MIRASKLVDGINLRPEKEYNSAEIFVNSKKLDADDLEDNFQLMPSSMQLLLPTNANPSSVVCQVKTGFNDGNILDKLCILCVENKSIQVVKKNKNMTPITSKLEEVHLDLWGPHNLPSQSGSSYAAILMCEYT